MIFGIYFNDERATYLDYVQPAFVFDPSSSSLNKDKTFPFTGQDDLIGKKGVTNQGESYGNDFDAFIKDKLDRRPRRRHRRCLQGLLDGEADYLIAGYYPGLAVAAKAGLKDDVVPLEPALLSAEMFVAFSKKSPCKSLAPQFGEGITALTTDGSFRRCRPTRSQPGCQEHAEGVRPTRRGYGARRLYLARIVRSSSAAAHKRQPSAPSWSSRRSSRRRSLPPPLYGR